MFSPRNIPGVGGGVVMERGKGVNGAFFVALWLPMSLLM